MKMKSLLVILTTSGLLFNVLFIVEAEHGINIKSPSGPAVHQPLMIFVNSDNLIQSTPYLGLSKFNEMNSGRKYIFACPAEESTDSSSQTKNSLTVKGMYVSKGEVAVNTESFEKLMNEKEQEFSCGKPVIPSFVHFREMTGESRNKYTVNAIGFEMYLNKFLKGLSNYKFEHQFLRFENNFHWVTIIEILFDPVGLDVRDVVYKMSAYDILPKRTTTLQVQNYTLGKVELFECVRIEELYSIENQRYVFTKIFKNEEERKNYFDVDQGKFLVQVHLAPLEIFMIPHLKEAARTYGNIAPMWRVVRENAWKKLEHFLHFVVQEVGVLNIISGTYDTLTLPSSEGIFLGNNQVRVPLAFYKIVIHQKTKDMAESILLVTVNNPYENIQGVLCNTNQCAEYGWDKIENTDYTKGFTSCCPLTKRILRLLDIDFLEPDIHRDVFNLVGKSFPEWERYSGIYHRDKTQEQRSSGHNPRSALPDLSKDLEELLRMK